MYDYCLDGEDNFEAARVAAEKVLALVPGLHSGSNGDEPLLLTGKIPYLLGKVTPYAPCLIARGVEFVKIADLPSLGFGERFAQLATDGFPGAGSYMGAKASIGL